MDYTLAFYTDIGPRKQANQDSLCVRRAAVAGGGEVLFAAVCDGMGGLEKGELASATVIRALETWFDSHVDLLARSGSFGDARRQLTDLIARENARLAAVSAAHAIQMGSTLTALLGVGDRFLTVNVGDSRVYAIRDGQAVQMTEDQSLVEMERQRGRITAEEARHHPQRNVLLQCIGMGRSAAPVFTEGALTHDTVYLLCSDGLSHELTPQELAAALDPVYMGDSRAMQNALIDLTEQCKARGETDNITAIAVKTAESAVAPAPPTGLLARLRRRNAPPEPIPAAVSPVEAAHILHTDEELL